MISNNAGTENGLESLACVVVNYNAGSLLQRCVESWSVAAPHSLLVIVDNASSDDSLKFLRTYLHSASAVRLVRNEHNLGFSAAVNQGLGVANADFSLVLNPDCVCTPRAVNAMLGVLRAQPGVGMVGPMLTNPDGSEQAGGRRAVPTPWRSFVRAFGLSGFGRRYPRLFSDFLLHHEPLPALSVEVEAISGACMLVKREALEDVGLLDERYFMHCEDLDWCMRFRKNGWKILFVPDAKIMHFKGACSRSRPLFVEWHKHKGMARFYRKFFRHQYPGVLMWLVTFGVWLRFGAVAIYYTVRRIRRLLRLVRG